MQRRYILGFLIIIMSVMFVTNLFADKARQETLEAQFRSDTGFDGTITWWDCDDTIKELQGYFTDMDVYYDDDEDYISETMTNIMQALMPYIGLTEDDFFKPEISYDSYVYPQKLNQMPIDRNGYVEIDMNDSDLSIYVYTLPKVAAPPRAEITKDQAYKHVQAIAGANDIDTASFDSMYLTYISMNETIISPQKPTSLSLSWSIKGKINWYFIDAISGKILKTRDL